MDLRPQDTFTEEPNSPNRIRRNHSENNRSLFNPRETAKLLQPEVSLECAICKRSTTDFRRAKFCQSCNETFHDTCWLSERRHVDGRCLDPVALDTQIWIRWLLSPPKSDEDQIVLHTKDLDSKWLGLPQDGTRRLLLYPRLESVLHDTISRSQERSMSGYPKRQYPRIASFFGETDAGKSTIIRALVRFSSSDSQWMVPITSRKKNQYTSTSSDIHLYQDPASFETNNPLFYADCEGIGGTRKPFSKSLLHTLREHDVSAARDAVRRRMPGLTIDNMQTVISMNEQTALGEYLDWAASPTTSTQAQTSESWESKVVDILYPRFLYTFSDVVCFVTPNPKSLERDIEQLLRWARNGHQLTLNQRVRPALIIIVNKVMVSEDGGSDFDVDNTTEDFRRFLQKSDRFRVEQDYWHSRGENCHDAQYSRLQNEIKNMLEYVSQVRHRYSDPEWDIETLNRYSRDKFSSLCRDINAVWDFHEVTERLRQAPSDIEHHIVNFLVRIKGIHYYAGSGVRIQEQKRVEAVLDYMASCLALELQRFQGIDRRLVEELKNGCRRAFVAFYDQHCACEEVQNGVQCSNFKITHEKGHQFRFGDTVYGADGVFRNESFNAEPLLHTLFAKIDELRNKPANLLCHNLSSEGRRKKIVEVYSNGTCLACLCRQPVYSLPCKHSICQHCALQFNRNHMWSNGYFIDLENMCPIGDSFRGTFRLKVKPPSAGVRMLCLDGGGVRGIIQLKLLEKLLSRIGYGIPIQELFDLALGTSTGGIVALALFKQLLSVESAKKSFKELVNTAFSARFMIKIPFVRYIAQLVYTFRYKSDGIETALKNVFGEYALFGETATEAPELVKVGVVATDEDDHHEVIISNYGRDFGLVTSINGPVSKDRLLRDEDVSKEMKTWEAARATSAAQTYFRRFKHAPSQRVFSDGALQANNPCRICNDERQYIWTAAERTPDIMISLGTGLAMSKDDKRKEEKRSLLHNGISDKVSIMTSVLRNTLDCDKQFEDFKKSVSQQEIWKDKLYRLNVGLVGDLPQLDRAEEVPELEKRVHEFLNPRNDYQQTPSQRQMLRQIDDAACRLIASLFYFDLEYVQSLSGPQYRWFGYLRCRLSLNLTQQFDALMKGGDGASHLSPRAFQIWESEESNSRVRLRGSASDKARVTFDRSTFSAAVEFETRTANKLMQMTVDLGRIDGVRSYSISGFPRLMAAGQSGGRPMAVELVGTNEPVEI